MTLAAVASLPVSTHSRPKAAGAATAGAAGDGEFQHTAARRQLVFGYRRQITLEAVSTHSRPKAAGEVQAAIMRQQQVSTHSRPKAAGPVQPPLFVRVLRFNTQPPEGSWVHAWRVFDDFRAVSTHSRPKAAGLTVALALFLDGVSTHSRPKAAGDKRGMGIVDETGVSTHSRPKAAGLVIDPHLVHNLVSTHSRPKAAGS